MTCHGERDDLKVSVAAAVLEKLERFLVLDRAEEASDLRPRRGRGRVLPLEHLAPSTRRGCASVDAGHPAAFETQRKKLSLASSIAHKVSD